MIIATGNSRLSLEWHNTEVSWQQLSQRLARCRRTGETMAEYRAMTKDQRGRVKDIGGFVGGALVADGPRRGSTIADRCLVTLDIDYGQSDTIDVVSRALTGKHIEWALYSTHSHAPEAPRYRLVIPLTRTVSPEEYIPLSRMLADTIDIELFDDSTYEPSRLMYWPSASKDGEYVYRSGEGEPCDPDVYLGIGYYLDGWRDVSSWPVSSRQKEAPRKAAVKATDPTTKRGLVGAFCRVYDIHRAIATYLPDVYVPMEGHDDRYTYVDGSTTGGLIVYDDGLFAYSHHGTDPICGREVNAFDLVRLHLFAGEDDGALPDTPPNRLPSWSKMEELCQGDREVKALLVSERISPEEAFGEASGDGPKKGMTWRADLHTDKKGNLISDAWNAQLICENDEDLKDTTRRDIFQGRDVLVRDLPWANITPDHKVWTDNDDDGLICFLSQNYNFKGSETIRTAHNLVMSRAAFHPVREYLSGLRGKWDGIPRLDTLLIDSLGAVDDPEHLTRAMTRKHFVAAVTRIFQPGAKYDYVLTFVGKEATGKSTLVDKMAKSWNSESFNSSDLGSKESMEQLRGKWLIEMAELKDYKRNSVEAFKAFISRRVDSFRPAYGRRLEDYGRQCVFFASTNEEYFLKGDTGNRRFWPVKVGVQKMKFPVRENPDFNDAYVDQIWAEAVKVYDEGKETLYLNEEQTALAMRRQESFNEVEDDARVGVIEAYLRKPLPADWYTRTKAQRRSYFQMAGGAMFGEDQGAMRREYICVAEVVNECFGKDVSRYEGREYKQLLNLIPGLKFVDREGPRNDCYGQQRRWHLEADFWAEKAVTDSVTDSPEGVTDVTKCDR